MADQSPPNCTGSGLGINLFTSSPDVHIGDTLTYDITVFNGITNSGGRVVCDATAIQAFVTTPDLVVHPIPLVRTAMSQGDFDFYPAVASYVVRAQDVQPDGTVRSRATDTGIIHQNDTDSQGGGEQGVNTEVSLPCIALLVQCAGGVGENGAITYTGTVTNCGNNTLVGVTVTNFVNGGQVQVTFITNLLARQIASFSGSWIPANPCSPSTATLVAQGIDQYTTHPRTVTSSIDATCSEVLNPGIKVAKFCPASAVSPGQLLTFSGTVSNTGNVALTNIVVVNNRPVANTVVFSAASLAPGAVSVFNGSYLAPTNCSVSDTLIASASSRCGVSVSDTASATCPIITTPGIAVTEVCPATPGNSGGSSSFSGVVRNSGNITLNNVVVVSDRPAANTVVFTTASLAPGASAAYSGTFTVPLNVCSVTTTVRASGNDSCTSAGVTNTTSATCPVTTQPAIAVALSCPAASSTNGGPITYSGTVRNSGNVTLNNIVVTDAQSSPATVLTVASLAAGASANFSASFTAPLNVCSVSSTVNASGADNCSQVIVSNSASATCPLATNPRIVVTQSCSGSPVSPGGVLSYSGSVSNAGNIALTNIVVTNDRTAPAPVFSAALLLPHASASFTGSYTVPAGTACSITSTLTARGNDNCSGIAVSDTAAATCAITGSPLLAVTLNCPATQVVTGNAITFSGTVSNPGNVTLNGITVTDSQASPSTVLSVASLAPGASANFTATFASPANACSVTSTVTARGTNTCAGVVATDTASATCALLTAPALIVRQNCPATPASPGGSITYSGSVSNAGNISLTNILVINNQVATNINPATFGTIYPPLVPPAGTVIDRFGVGNNFNGLTFAGSDEGYTANQFYSLRHEASGNSTFVTINANGTVTGRFDAGNKNFDALTFAAPDVGYGPVIFYYLSHDNAGRSSFGTIKPGGATGVVADLFLVGTNFDALTFAATDVGYGANLFYYLRHDGNGRSTFGSINPALPGTVTDRFNVGTNFDALAFTATDVGYGASSVFYYLRHDSTGHSIFGTISATGTVTDRFNVGTNFTELAFATTDVGFAANLFYYLRAGATTANSTNSQPVFALPSLAPGASANFTGSYSVPASSACSITTIVTATARDVCTGITVTNITTTTCPLATAPGIAVTLNCPNGATAPGAAITYRGTVRNSGNVTLNGVTVADSQTSPGTVLSLASLAPGASADFTASFTAPLSACSVSSSVVARGTDACTGGTVSNSASATCPIGTAPSITITENCSATPVGPGGVLPFSGTVRNTGNSTLTNVVVTSDHTGATPVLSLPVLAAGAVANYAGSYSLPANNACTVTTVVTVTGRDTCSGITASNTASVTCPITGNPRIVVTQICPLTQVSPGGTLVYSGTVSNAGNVALNGIVVTSDRTGATPVFTIASLAPRATATFTGSYLTHSDCCVDSSTVIAIGHDCNNTVVSDTATRTCSLLTRPAITVTAVCSPTASPLASGDLLTYSGIVSNSGNITLVNVTLVNDIPTNGSVFGPVTLAAGEFASYSASFIVPADFCGTHTVTARGLDSCTHLPVAASATTICPVLPTLPRIAVTKNCPAQPTPHGGTFTFTGTVSNPGTVTLVNVFVVNDQPAANTPVIGPITLAPGASRDFSGSYPAPTDCCAITDTLTAHGQDRCGGTLVAATATQICPLLTTPRIAVVEHCPSAAVPVGGLYEFTGSVTNTGDVVLLNVYVVSSQPASNTVVLGPIELAPGESEEFNGSFTLVAGAGELIVTAAGVDTCQARVATASANCSGPIGSSGGGVSSVPVPGAYSGLFYLPTEIQNSNSGGFTFTLKASGAYTASLLSEGRKYSTSGTLNSNGKATNSVARSHNTGLTVIWDVDGSDGISGTVAEAGGQWVASLSGERAVFNARANPAPQAGKYTLIIPGTPGVNDSPEGDGYGAVTVDGSGQVRFTGTLADGTRVTQTASVSRTGHWPMYASLYKGHGSLLGWLAFADRSGDDVAGKLNWIRPSSSAKLYPAGFGVDSDSLGSRYVMPNGISSRVLEITNGVVNLTGGNLAAPSANHVSLDMKSKITSAGPNTLSMSFTLSSGLFKGSFIEAGTSRKITFGGAVLQKTNNASGYFPGGDQNGRVSFQAAP
jgi:uncharacterized repeat protein (TIGR01451 family)